MKKCDIVILPEKKRIQVSSGQNIMFALAEEGIFLRADCGGNGRCGKCLVKITTDLSQANLGGINENNKEIWHSVRACQETVTQDLLIDIPEATGLSPDIVRKPPVSDTLKSRIASVSKHKIKDSHFCVAVDLGTTTIAVYLCDIGQGIVAGSISLKNPQVLFGNDVISRITALNENTMVLKRLQQMVVKAVNWGIQKLFRTLENEGPGNIHKMVVVGNPTMLHLFLGKDPSSIGEAPYEPRFHGIQTVAAGGLGFEFSRKAEVQTFPLISGFLGADIVAAALAVDLKEAEFGTVLADVGTNGELMAKGRWSVVGTSCATGPALEGAAIKHGMQAVPGAISAVSIDVNTGKCRYAVKGDEGQKPSGICGSGIISAVAEMVRYGIIVSNGRFNQKLGIEAIRLDPENIPEFVLVPESESETGKAITLTQADIRNVQLAKGAFRTGIDLICEYLGVDVPTCLMIAGAFGNYIQKEDALTIGMLPPMPEKNIHIVGNAAGEGAILALFDPQQLMVAKEIVRNTQVIDLASHERFQNHFVDSLSFPEAPE